MDKLKNLIIFLLTISISYLTFSNLNILLIKGNSMDPTYSNYSIVNYTEFNENTPITYTDVIYFEHDEMPIVKRIFAKSGDSVKCNEKLSINGIKTNALCNEKFEYSIKEGEYFVLGDNINQSTDSRAFGTINERQIIGVVKWKKLYL